MLKRLDALINLPLWLEITLLAVFILRIPSFFEPYWYGDEAITLTLGEGIRQGLMLYRDIHDNKPPLLYLFGALAGNVFWLRVILAFWNSISIIFFWKLASLLWPKNPSLARTAAIIFGILTTIPLIEGNIANGEIFMIGPTIISFYLLTSRKNTLLTVFTAGLIFALGILFKAPSLFEAGVIGMLWFALLIAKKTTFREFALKSLTYTVGVAVPIILTILYFWVNNALGAYLTAAFTQNISYLSSWKAGWNENTSITSSPAFLIRMVILAIGLSTLTLLFLKKILTYQLYFTGLWFSFSLFAVTLSERPYPHYLLQVAPSFSLVLANMISNRTKYQFFSYPLLLILGSVLIIYKFNYYAVIKYYKNTLLWVTKQQTTEKYFDNFDKRVNRNYSIVRFLNESMDSGDTLFVWGNDAEIYALTRKLPPVKYVVAYHIFDFNARDNTLTVLKEKPPKYIIATAPPTRFPELYAFLNTQYFILDYKDDATIWLRKNTMNTNSTP